MALSVNWATKVITVPKADTTFVRFEPVSGREVREYDVDAFRLELKDLEDDEIGIVFDDTHNHTTEVTLSGVTYARFVEIINGYTVEFENGTYAVELFGANHNIGDTSVANSVQIRTFNSAGLIVTTGGGGSTPQDIADAVWDEAIADHLLAGSTGEALNTAATTGGGGTCEQFTATLSPGIIQVMGLIGVFSSDTPLDRDSIFIESIIGMPIIESKI